MISRRDDEVVIDDDIRPSPSSIDRRNWEILPDPPVPSGLYYQFSGLRSTSRSSSLASLPPAVLSRRPSSPFRDMLSDSPASSSPHSQFSDPRSPSRSSSLASLPPAVLPRRSSSPFRDMLSDHPVPSRPYVPRSSSRSSSLAPLSPIVLPLRSSIQFSTASHTPAPEITLNPFPPTHRDARTIHKYQPAPVALGILKSLDRDEGQHISHSRAVHELSEDSLIIDDRDKAEKKENKKFFLDGIIRDRDTDKDRDRGRDKDRKDRKNRERNKRREMDKGREKDKEQAREHHWREEDNPEELTRVIGHLTATSSDDWALILEACKRACASEANAREATKALRREFKYAEPEAQLSAARLWAVMLGNASDVFLTQISSRKFISALEDVLTNSRTKPVVRERLMEVLAAAAFITSSRLHPKDRIRVLWTCLKPADKPDVGIPFDPEDAALIPLILPVHPPMEEHSAALIPNALLASGGGDAMLPTPPAEGRSYEGPNSSSAHAIHDVSTTSTESKLAEERDRVDDNDKDSVGDIELLHVRFPQVESDSHSLVPPGEMLQDLTTLITKVGDYPVTRGGFGEVWKCIYQTDQGPTDVAVKALLVYVSDHLGKGIEKKTNRIQRELRTCASLQHKNILPVFGYTNGFGPLVAIVCPWAENGNLMTYLEQDATLPVIRRFQILIDITAGLQYLHSSNVIHGDLTGPNVLIHGDGTACLADFGLSLVYSEVLTTAASWTSAFHGNFRWLAPELLGDSEDELPVRPSKHSDIYSFGGIMLQVLTGKMPYYYLNEAAVIQRIGNGIKPLRVRYPVVSDKYWHFLRTCWSDAIESRPTVGEVVEWIGDEFDSLGT